MAKPVLQAFPLSMITSGQVEPHRFQVCFDDVHNNGLGIMIEQPNGSLKFISQSELTKEFLDTLEATGVFKNAAAFVQNRKVFRMFFDNTRKTVRIDPKLRFESSYRYFAIRQVAKNVHGVYDYVTGVQIETSPGVFQVLTNLVDMDIVMADDGITEMRKPAIGNTLMALEHAKNYVVEYYDDDRLLIADDVFQARVVRALSFDVTPDVAITDIIVSTNRPYNAIQGAMFLYRHETVDVMDIRVFLKYTDGTTRDITHEQVVGGRLSITGLDTIDSSVLSQNQTFKVTYRFVDTQAVGGGGGTVNQVNSTISRDVQVVVIEDIYDVCENITPAVWISGDPSSGSGKINLRVFGNYRSGRTADITALCQISGLITTDNMIENVPQNVIVRVPQGHIGTFKNFSFTLQTLRAHRYGIITGMAHQEGLIHRIQTAHLNGSPVFNFALAFKEPDTAPPVPLAYFQNQYKYINPETTTEYVPTHFRIRNVIIDPSYLYTDRTVMSSANLQFGYVAQSGRELYEEYPVLVEFIKVTTGAGGEPTSIFTTGSMIVYVKLGL